VSRGFQALFVACILVASTAMFALAESRKLDRAPIKALVLTAGPQVAGKPRPALFSPTCGCATSYASISFKLGKPGPLQAFIVSPEGAVIKQIASFKDVRRVSLRWDGRNEAGKVVADGSYRLRLKIAGSTRTLPVFVAVRTALPQFRAAAAPHRLTLNGDGVDDRTTISWTSPVQLFGIKVVAVRDGQKETVPVFEHSKVGSVQWPRVSCKAGVCHAPRPADGAWALTMTARDGAGNLNHVALGDVEVAPR
jgi:hypothetical protein